MELQGKPSTNNKTRLEYIDVARGIAMICIVLGHMGIPRINQFVFTFHVPVFYLISGYFISQKLPVKQFVAKRARILLVPYCVAASAIVVARILENEFVFGGGNTKETIVRWIGAALYGVGDSWDLPFWPWHVQSIGALWFLWASFWGCIILRVLLECSPVKRVIAVGTIFTIGVWTSYQGWILPLSIQAGACGLLWVYLGWLWGQWRKGEKPVGVECRIVAMALCLLMWASFVRNFTSFWLVHSDLGRGIVDVVGSLCACYAFVRICECVDKGRVPLTKPLASFGKYSLIALCVHALDDHMDFFRFIVGWLPISGVSDFSLVVLHIVFKVMLVVVCTAILSNINATRVLFGFKRIRRSIHEE